MNATDVINKLKNRSISKYNLKYCLVDISKHPYRIDKVPARPNQVDDFVDFETLSNSKYTNLFAGIGISIQASKICAIDVDKCFSIPNNVDSGDERAKYFLEKFKDIAYCEFSFSGTGLRIIFYANLIDNYSDKYYIKNETTKIEYYQPANSFRYVTLTGNVIYNNDLKSPDDIENTLFDFLNKYMLRPQKSYNTEIIKTEDKSFEELMKMVKIRYLKDSIFQDLWFTDAPGSGKDESERDYHLVAYLYENITQNKDFIKQIFEQSNFYKTKDWKHMRKWSNQNFRYFNYLYDNIRRNYE